MTEGTRDTPLDPPPLDEHRVGDVIGSYRLTRLLGCGGMGAVYEAQQGDLGRRCALKVLHSEYATDPVALRRMLREAKTAGSIDHANIVRAWDFGITPRQGTCYVAMELLQGETLAQYVEEQGPLPEESAIHIALQVLSALVAIHERGVVHRDLKPENVFVSQTGEGGLQVKLLDFGISKYTLSETETLRLTSQGRVLGTPYFMSPEQAMGSESVDRRTDIWAMGVLLFVMLTRDLPFPGNNYNQVMMRIVTEPHPPLRELRPDIQESLAALVDRALAKEPADRFQSAEEMHQAVVFAFQATESLPVADPEGETRRVPFPAELRPAPEQEPAGMPTSLDAPSLEGTQALSREHRLPRRPGALLWVVGGAVLLGLLIIGIVTLGLRKERKAHAPDRPTPPATLPAREAPPPGELVAPMTARAPGTEKATLPEPSPPRRLSVQVKGLPPGATLRLDGRKTTAPLSLLLDGNEHILEVSAPGFKSHAQLFRANDDLRVLHVRLQRGPRRHWTRTRGRGVRPPPMVTMDGVFPNPHTMR